MVIKRSVRRRERERERAIVVIGPILYAYLVSLSLSLPAPVVPSIDFQDVGHSSGRPPANKPNQEQDVPNCRATFAHRFVAKLDHPSNRADDYYPPSINGKCLNNRIDFRYFPSFSILPRPGSDLTFSSFVTNIGKYYSCSFW